MTYLERIRTKVRENLDDEILTLKELVSIRSVAERQEGSAPFGEGVEEAFGYMLDRAADFGFETLDVDGFGGHIQFGGSDGEDREIMGIAAHLDCVPEGEGWTHDPFACEIEDGKLYGRGTSDDKGPAVAALFAMKALSDLGMEPKKRVRLILGLDEETDWEGMRYYLDNEEMPTFGFTPDSDFPVVNGEKGILVFHIAKKFGKTNAQGLEFRSFRGGEADNMVAASARVIVNSKKRADYDSIRERAAYFEEMYGVPVKTKAVGKSLEITVKGTPAHGAHPEQGRNAISYMMAFLGMLDFTNDDVTEFIDFYNGHIGTELNGERLGCLFSDEVSGDTILNVGKIDMDTASARLTINIRFPITKTAQDIYEGIDEVCSRYDLGIIKDTEREPVYKDVEGSLVKELVAAYREITGDEVTQPLVIGGGTYARLFDDFVAFGAKFPGGEDVEHQKDEYVKLTDLENMTVIYAEAIRRLAGGMAE